MIPSNMKVLVDNFIRGISQSNAELVRRSVVNDDSCFLNNILKESSGIRYIYDYVYKYWKSPAYEIALRWDGPLMITMWYKCDISSDDAGCVYVPISEQHGRWTYILVRPRSNSTRLRADIPVAFYKVGVPIILVGESRPLVSVLGTCAYLDSYDEKSLLYPGLAQVNSWGLIGKNELNRKWVPFQRDYPNSP